MKQTILHTLFCLTFFAHVHASAMRPSESKSKAAVPMYIGKIVDVRSSKPEQDANVVYPNLKVMTMTEVNGHLIVSDWNPAPFEDRESGENIYMDNVNIGALLSDNEVVEIKT